MKLNQPLRKICIYFEHRNFSKPLLCDTAICNRLFQISLYIHCSSRKDFEDRFWHEASLSPSPLPCGEQAKGGTELCRGAALSWHLEDGQISKSCQAASLKQHLHRPLQYPFQWPAGKSSCMPALIPIPQRQKTALPPLPAKEEGRKHRGGESTSGINWRALNASERTAELAETIARICAFKCDYGVRAGEWDIYSILKHKTRAHLGALFLMQTAKCLSPVTLSLPLVYHGYSQNSVQKTGDKTRTAPFEEMGLICDSTARTRQHNSILYQAALGVQWWRKSGTDVAHIWEQKFDCLETQVSFHSSFHCISAFSYLPPLICSRSLPFSRKPPLYVLESRGSRKEHSPVQQPSNND